MRPLRSGEEAQLSWDDGAVECRVVAAAGAYVLLRPTRAIAVPSGECSLTYLDGYVPMGFDGVVEAGSHPSELRFRVTDHGRPADRRGTPRVPVAVAVEVSLTMPVGDEAPVSEGRVLDVSAGGMRFRRLGRLPKGTPVRVRAELPGGPVIDADAVVRASEPGIYSVEYTRMHSEVGAWTIDVLRSALIAA
jgi:hypothetical protein